MDRALRDLIAISRAVGADPALVQGGGGNTSVKSADGEFMYIKASGTALKDMSEVAGWRRLRMRDVKAILTEPELPALDPAEREAEVARRLLGCCEDACTVDARPSVESHLHAALGRCVVHLHPTAVCAYVCAKDGRAELERLFREPAPLPLWVPYADPGYMLARLVERLTKAYRARHGRPPSVLFLQKHGLLVTAETRAGVLRLVKDVIARCERGLSWRAVAGRGVRASPERSRREPRGTDAALTKPAPNCVAVARMAVRKALWRATASRFAVRRFVSKDIAAFLARRDAQRLALLPPLTPDELACAQGPPVWAERWDAEAIGRAVAHRIERSERAPLSFLGRGMGLLVAGTEKGIPAVRDLVVASLMVRAHAASFGGPNPLAPRQRRFIAEWEGENSRRAILAGLQEGELAGRIAVVTGAGSGLGRAISLGLSGAGALVALADVDVPSAKETARLIAEERPGAAALPAKCDVTDEGAVERACHAVLERWGGLDILVNAAGIAPAHDLVDLPAREWRRALEINLTGYFLMAQAAARIMIQQGMGGSIINLSSKSGLEASRSNTAYNATKAGQIHMARGWALELGQHGIRVNSLAPGNVFQGSKIWNRKYIEACARKYGIRPEEVIPYYVNMTALKREITGQDVADAVVFLCSERARNITGQTVVVDGGQVMVR
jgi:NAD(P)-dependent dehydrogenase (short-subunit alcohol dehydrogenase family)/rhamnose utilization protein RhaD (predicted bifunctional aldolase and dehydrogenase)